MNSRRLLLSTVVGLGTFASTIGAQPPVSDRDLPARILWERDGAEMVLVPAGEFLSGVERKVETLPAFHIDRYEVSRVQYARHLRDQGQSPTVEPGQEDFAEDSMNLSGARKYAAWAGKRVPTVREWEKAARGTDGRFYPWGGSYREEWVVAKGPASVRSCPEGASPYGAVNMVGNVSEWTVDFSALVRGGNIPWETQYQFHWCWGGPDAWSGGLRCALSPKDLDKGEWKALPPLPLTPAQRLGRVPVAEQKYEVLFYEPAGVRARVNALLATKDHQSLPLDKCARLARGSEHPLELRLMAAGALEDAGDARAEELWTLALTEMREPQWDLEESAQQWVRSRVPDETATMAGRAWRRLGRVDEATELLRKWIRGTHAYPTREFLALIACNPEAAYEELHRVQETRHYEFAWVARLYGQLGDPRAVPILREAAVHHDNYQYAGAAASALGMIGTQEALKALQEVAVAARAYTTRGAAVHVLCGAAGVRGFYDRPVRHRIRIAPETARNLAVEGLTGVARRETWRHLRQTVLDRLTAAQGVEALPLLVETLATASDPQVAETAFRCWQGMQPVACVAHCREALSTEPPGVLRLNASCALLSARHWEGAEALRILTERETVPLLLRLRAADALLRHRGVLDALGYPDEQRLHAIETVCHAAQATSPIAPGEVTGLVHRLAGDLAGSGCEEAAIRAWRWVACADNSRAAGVALKELSKRGIDATTERGAILSWFVIGPFDNSDRGDLSRAFLPELEIDLEATYAVGCETGFSTEQVYDRRRKELIPRQNTGAYWRPRKWKIVGNAEPGGGIKPYPRVQRAVVYALCFAESDRRQSVQLRVESWGPMRAWFNEQQVWRDANEEQREVRIVPLDIPLGRSPLLLKFAVAEGTPYFSARITQPDGRGAPGLRFEPVRK